MSVKSEAKEGTLIILRDLIKDAGGKVRLLRKRNAKVFRECASGGNSEDTLKLMKENVREIKHLLRVIGNNIDLLYFTEPWK